MEVRAKENDIINDAAKNNFIEVLKLEEKGEIERKTQNQLKRMVSNLASGKQKEIEQEGAESQKVIEMIYDTQHEIITLEYSIERTVQIMTELIDVLGKGNKNAPVLASILASKSSNSLCELGAYGRNLRMDDKITERATIM